MKLLKLVKVLRSFALFSTFSMSMLLPAQTLIDNNGNSTLPTPSVPTLPSLKPIDKSNHCFSFYGSAPFTSRYITKLDRTFPLGASTSTYPKRTLDHNIIYHTRGMEYQDECTLEKRLEAIKKYTETAPKRNPKLTTQQISDYRHHAEMLVSTPDAFGDAIDRCFDSIKEKWLSCGGKYAQTANYMERIKSQLRVQVMPSYFFVSASTGGAIWVAGMADLDKRTIFAIVPHLHSKGYIRTFESLVCWEMGNTFGLNANHFPKTLSQEIGFQSPCNR
jgi:hypothetical protein